MERSTFPGFQPPRSPYSSKFQVFQRKVELRNEVASSRAIGLNELVIEKTLKSSFQSDSSILDFNGLENGGALQIKARKILEKINELLQKNLPEGVESLKPKEHTPEATASRVVQSIAALFPAFQKQNPELSEAETVEKFMKLAREGVESGYSDAFEALESIGAFELDGIQSSIEETHSLIKAKLDEFEKFTNERLGITPNESAANDTTPKTEANGVVPTEKPSLPDQSTQ